MDEQYEDLSKARAFACAKCGGAGCETGKIRTTGDGVSRYMNLQNQKFGYITCDKCGFAEFYRDFGKDRGWKTVLDVLSN